MVVVVVVVAVTAERREGEEKHSNTIRETRRVGPIV